MSKHVFYLRRSHATHRQCRKIVLAEKLHLARFQAAFRLPSAKISQEKEFEHMMCDWRMSVLVAIVDRGQFLHGDLITGFFLNFPYGRSTGRVADISPSAGQGPQPVFPFTYQQDAIAVKHCRAYIDFRCRISPRPVWTIRPEA
jgi:hypothetical protein